MASWTGWYPTEQNTNFIYVYDPDKDEWTTRNALPSNRRRGAAAVVVSEDEQEIYVTHGNSGGHEGETTDFATSYASLDKYNIATDTWTELPSGNYPRDHVAAALSHGKICVAGGRDGGTPYWPEVAPTECYDIETGTWSIEADIPQLRAGSAFGTTCDGKLMVAGGERMQGYWAAYSQVDVFNMLTMQWEQFPPLVQKRHGTGLAFDCQCNRILILSGRSDSGGGPENKSLEIHYPSGTQKSCDVTNPSLPSASPSAIPTKNPTKAPVVYQSVSPTRSAAPSMSPMETIYITCGSNSDFVDEHGHRWVPDAPYVVGGKGVHEYTSNDIQFTNSAPLFQTGRFFADWNVPAPYIYEIPVHRDHEFVVTLMWAENYFTDSGFRVFDVYIEGSLMIDNLDIFREVGKDSALSITLKTFVSDGSLTIELVPKIENPKLSAIIVVDTNTYISPTISPTISSAPSGSPSAMLDRDFQDIFINCGGGVHVSSSGAITWLPDKWFIGGNTYTDGSVGIDIQDTLEDWYEEHAF